MHDEIMGNVYNSEIENQTRTSKVWYVYGGNVPSNGFYTHLCKETAEAEAKRLAKANPDKIFRVLETVAAYINPSSIKMTLLDDSIPF